MSKYGYEDLVVAINRHRATGKGKIVYPGKSLSSADIRARLRNGSIEANADRMAFSGEKGIAELQGMSKIDLMRSHANEKPKLIDKRKQIEARVKKAENDGIMYRIKSGIEEGISKLAKDKGDGKG